MPLWFVVSTVVVLGVTGTIVQVTFRRWELRQEAEYEGFRDRPEQDQRDLLLELSKRKLRLLRWVLSAVTVVVVIGAWYTGGSLFLIGRNNDETNRVVDRVEGVVTRMDDQQEAQRLFGCRQRNTNNAEARRIAGERDEEVVRQVFLALAAAVAAPDPPSDDLLETANAAAQDAIDGLPEITTPELDSDCDLDGTPGSPGDYLEE